jgi:hypothetical protein
MPLEGWMKATLTTKIKPSDVNFLITELTRRREGGEDCGFEAQAFILLHHYRKSKNKPIRMFATVERLRCLGEIMKDERMRGWTMQTKDPGCILTHEAVFDATALCRLVEKDEKLAFDTDQFFDLVLRRVEPEAHA